MMFPIISCDDQLAIEDTKILCTTGNCNSIGGGVHTIGATRTIVQLIDQLHLQCKLAWSNN